MTTDAPDARLQENITLMCRVAPGFNLTADILFTRLDGDVSKVYGMISQLPNNCKSAVGSLGYTPFCGPGTDKWDSSVRMYTLQIESVAEADYTKWWCQTQVHKQTFNIVTLKNAGGKYHWKKIGKSTN